MPLLLPSLSRSRRLPPHVVHSLPYSLSLGRWIAPGIHQLLQELGDLSFERWMESAAPSVFPPVRLFRASLCFPTVPDFCSNAHFFKMSGVTLLFARFSTSFSSGTPFFWFHASCLVLCSLLLSFAWEMLPKGGRFGSSDGLFPLCPPSSTPAVVALLFHFCAPSLSKAFKWQCLRSVPLCLSFFLCVRLCYCSMTNW
eukprot:RCo044365